MTLSSPAARKHLHSRQILCQGFSREDGLWDIEGRLEDKKTYGFENRWRGRVDAGMPVHDMRVRLTLDDKFVVRDIEVSMPASPFKGCASIAPDFNVLIGERVGRGWNRKVAELVGGTRGCTHMTEVLGRMAMAAYQTIPIELHRRARHRAGGDREAFRALMKRSGWKPHFIDGCHTWRSDGETVKRELPEFYKAPTGADKNDG